MAFIFICPESCRVFESDEFTIVENRGVAVDADGTRRLDARVRLDSPCPHCGGIHEYRADELVCPFSGGGSVQEKKRGDGQ